MQPACRLGAVAVGGLIIATAVVGCSKKQTTAAGSSPDSGPAREYHVVFSQCNNAEPYRAAQNALLRKLCAEKPGVKLDIVDAQQDNKKQIDQIRSMILRKPSLLIVAPNEREPLTRVMGEAMAEGMCFVGVDGLGGPAGGIKKVMDGQLACTFVYPLCVDKALEIGWRILTEEGFTPEKSYLMESTVVTPENAAALYAVATVE